ncbi:MAG: hypothetical protein WBV85_11520 [Solirubrobacteraceae bacterium]
MPTAKTTTPKPRATAAKAATAAKTATTSKRSTTAPKRTAAASKQSSTAERAVLIPIGAALIARERVLSEVSDAIANYNSTSKAGAQLRKFERRGVTARNRLEREVRKTRVRVEREVRKTRTSVERELRQRRRESEELADKVQERILNLV